VPVNPQSQQFLTFLTAMTSERYATCGLEATKFGVKKSLAVFGLRL
jgi:hypothetical protein